MNQIFMSTSSKPPTSNTTNTTMNTTSTNRTLPGRVVRLHFQCRAELPMGSFLRVTGSTLWAPGTSASDPAEAAPAVHRTEPAAFPVNSEGDVDFGSASPQQLSSLYASSVEMVTTPEDYPVWRTRKPVVVVLHRHAATKKSVQHHYYRYLVVSPGAVQNSASLMGEDQGAVVSTSNEFTGSTVVMQWEDPFQSLQKNRDEVAAVSTLSLTSSIGLPNAAHTRADYRNLPYRTLDIDVTTGTILVDDAGGSSNMISMDHWNVAEDDTFQPYQIRTAIQEENRRKLQPSLSNVSDTGSMDVEMPPVDENMETDAPPSSGGHNTPPAFSSNNRIFFVCFHLPVVVVQNQSTGEWQASWSESILAKTEGSTILSTYQAYWVGTITTHPPLQTEIDRAKVRALLEEMKCIPIFLDPAIRQSHYYGFCKQVLWPAFHNIDLLDLSTCGWLSDPNKMASDWDQSRLDDWWNSFNAVSREFSNKLAGLLKAGDIVWIHDYHLSLLPQQLTTWEMAKFGCKVTRKVFFLHIPFPTSQIFRELECGEKILTGMLHADVVGFHAFDHARHFLNAAKRILGLNYTSLVGGLIGVSFQGSTVLVSMSNVSIEPRMVDAALMLPSVRTGKEELREKHAGRRIIGGVDIGQRLSGTSLKLLAYERLLKDYPSWQSKVVMVQRLLLPGSRKTDEDVTCREARALVKRIQDKFGEAVIDYKEVAGASLPMDQRLALWKASDVYMCTPIREGLNHWPMEYIYSHREPEEAGVVITSEFSAICSILNGALRVNPYDIQATITTIDKALSMDRQEREGRRYRDIGFVSNSQSDKWVKNVLRDLRDATSANKSATGSESTSQTATPYATPNPSRKMPLDNTAAFLARESNIAFDHLHLKLVKKAYESTKRRVIILDFNGTIVVKEPPGKYLKREILGSSGNKPAEVVVDALQKLSTDPHNTVYVVSGDSSENVMNALGHLPSLGLAVSNGACFSPPLTSPNERRRWLTFDLGVDWDAVKRVALPVLSKYTARSNGSFVKLTSFSIGWSYYSCDPEWGSLQATHLVLELENELRAFDVRFVTLKGIVEIVPRKLNKGLIVKKVLHDLSMRTDLEGDGLDFILCFGDDISDEKMFTSVYSFTSDQEDLSHSEASPPVFDESGKFEDPSTSMETDEKMKTAIPDPQYAFTVAVGKKPSHACSYVNDAQEVANALVMLAQGEIPEGGVPVWGSSSAMFD